MANETEKKGISKGVIAIAAFIGGILGTAAGLLLAPQPGAKTREKIKETYNDLSSNINNVVKKIDEKAPEVISKVKSEIKEIPEEVKEGTEKIKSKGKEYVKEVKKTISTSLEEGKKKFLKEKEKGGK